MRILLVEDDQALADGLKQSLHRKNYTVDTVSSGNYAIAAVAAMANNEFELIILDLGLPDMDGIEVLKKCKSMKSDLPVLILTARDGIENRVLGLDHGADDYLAKPFHIDELLARIRVIERRLSSVNTNVITINDLSLDVNANTIEVNGENINLSRKEYMIAKLLIENVGRIKSKAQLESGLYEWGEELSSNAIEVHMHNLRKKLPKDFVQTVRGVGYIVRKP